MTGRAEPAFQGDRLGAEFDVILAQAQRGDSRACTRIYESFAPAVAGYFHAQGAPEPDDLVSEVFLRMYLQCPSFSGDEAQFRAWVFTIAHSRLIDARRAGNRAPEVCSMEFAALDGRGPTVVGADEEAMERLAVTEIQQLLRGLTDDQADVLALRLMSQMSVDEVAILLGKPPGAVKALQRRALASLRRRLAKER